MLEKLGKFDLKGHYKFDLKEHYADVIAFIGVVFGFTNIFIDLLHNRLLAGALTAGSVIAIYVIQSQRILKSTATQINMAVAQIGNRVDNIDTTATQIANVLDSHVKCSMFKSADDAFIFLTSEVRNAKYSIDQVAIAETPSQLTGKVREDYRAAQGEFCKKNHVHYRYAVDPAYKPRLKALQTLSMKYGPDRKDGQPASFHLKYLSVSPKSPPALNFFIFDDQAVFMRYPHKEATEGHYVYTNQKDIVDLFRLYYTRIDEVAQRSSH